MVDIRSACWSVTVFNDEIGLIEDSSKFPSFVKEVHGGREECPKSGNIHFQGAVVCKSQQRFNAIKKWLPTAHIEPARQKEALIKYAMKEETAVGEKTTTTNPRQYLSMAQALKKIASCVYCDMVTYNNRMDSYHDSFGVQWTMKKAMEEEYWRAVNRLLRDEDDENISLYSNPQLLRSWVHTYETWRYKFEQERSIVLQTSSNEDFKNDPELMEGEIVASQTDRQTDSV